MKNNRSIILVSGATGKQGGAVARELLLNGYRVRAMTRDPSNPAAKELGRSGAEIVKADFDRPETIGEALKGVWGVFSVQNSWEAGVEREEAQGKRFAELARRARVEHFVYSSVSSADRKTGIPHFESKARIEEKVRSLSFPSSVILRPVSFMENWISPLAKPDLEKGRITMAVKPETRLQMIAVEDIGRFGRLAFERDKELKGREIDIAGDQRTLPQVAEILGRVLGRTVTFEPAPIAEVRKQSADYAAMLEWFDRVGYSVDIQGLIKAFGIKPLTLAEWADKKLRERKAA